MTMKYLKINGFVLPNLVTNNSKSKINKYGLLRLDYIKMIMLLEKLMRLN